MYTYRRIIKIIFWNKLKNEYYDINENINEHRQ